MKKKLLKIIVIVTMLAVALSLLALPAAAETVDASGCCLYIGLDDDGIPNYTANEMITAFENGRSLVFLFTSEDEIILMPLVACDVSPDGVNIGFTFGLLFLDTAIRVSLTSYSGEWFVETAVDGYITGENLNNYIQSFTIGSYSFDIVARDGDASFYALDDAVNSLVDAKLANYNFGDGVDEDDETHSMYTICRDFVSFFLAGCDPVVIDFFTVCLAVLLAGGIVSLICSPVVYLITLGRKKKTL